MLFHIPKQSNWVECVVIDFLLRFFSDEEGNSKILSWDRETTIIFINVCVQVCLCVLRVRVKTFNTWLRKVLKL